MSKEISKRQMIRERRAREAMRNRLVYIGLIVLLALVIFGVFVGPVLNQILNPYTPVVPEARSLPNADDNALGDPDAPITVTEYSDFQCPYCARFWEDTEEQLISTYVESGQVRFVYRSFGSFIGPESGASAEAAYCAGDQGKFWEMHAIIFANQTGENVGAYSNSKLEAFAEAIGLDLDAYKDCRSSDQFASRVTQDGIDGISAGIEATPSFVVSYVLNGETQTSIIQGAQPFSEFQTAIEAALAALGLK